MELKKMDFILHGIKIQLLKVSPIPEAIPNRNPPNPAALFFFNIPFSGCFFPFAVDDLLKEAKVGPHGTIKYEEFVHLLCLPSVDY